MDVALAKCLGKDPELFFSDDEENYNAELVNRAKIICAQCPLITECLAQAIEEELDGIWGGTTTFERRVAEDRKRKNYIPKPKVISEANEIARNEANKKKSLETALRDKPIFERALSMGIGYLDDITHQLIEYRVKHLDKSLDELSEMFDPPLSRDVVSGRLRRVKKKVIEDGLY